uniref:Nuclear receptor n=1 Tax=Panagrolaimus sp. ES5 TaxID=591445 RepID=A0AC34GNU0_9BILA
MFKESKIVLPNILFESCLVCGKLTSKLHLQVHICYGCAAFYRRSINSSKNYRCRNNKQQCDLKNQSKPICRLCRFNSCKALELKVNKSYPKIIFSFELEYKPDETDPWNVVDLFYQINSTFKKYSNASNYANDFEKSMSHFLDASEPPNKEYIFYASPEASILSRTNFTNKFAINTAKLLLTCPNFQKLPLNEKVLIHDRFWQMFIVLRNFYLSYERFGRGPELKCVIDNVQYVDHTNLQKCMQIDTVSEESKIFLPSYRAKGSTFFREFKKLTATFFEFNYICLISLWSFHSLPQLSDTTQKLGDTIIKEASEKLHNYYITELRRQDYASRQAQLFKIAFMVENMIENEYEIVQAWKLFNKSPNEYFLCKFRTNYCIYKS